MRTHICAIDSREPQQNDDKYVVEWADGDQTDRIKTKGALRSCQIRTKEYFDAMNKKPLMSDTFGVWEEDTAGSGRKRKQAEIYKYFYMHTICMYIDVALQVTCESLEYPAHQARKPIPIMIYETPFSLSLALDPRPTACTPFPHHYCIPQIPPNCL